MNCHDDYCYYFECISLDYCCVRHSDHGDDASATGERLRRRSGSYVDLLYDGSGCRESLRDSSSGGHDASTMLTMDSDQLSRIITVLV